jgi:hypothetical protein
MSAHRPRIAECSAFIASAYPGSLLAGRRDLRASATKRFCGKINPYSSIYTRENADLERDDALTLRAPYDSRERLARHLSYLDVLVCQAVEQRLHDHPGLRARDAQQVAVEEDDKRGERIQTDPPCLDCLLSVSMRRRVGSTYRRRAQRVHVVVQDCLDVLGWAMDRRHHVKHCGAVELELRAVIQLRHPEDLRPERPGLYERPPSYQKQMPLTA